MNKYYFCTTFFLAVLALPGFAQERITFLHPFRIDIDPMERLLLINFEKDPDSLYVGFEPQVFLSSEGVEQHLVIGWRSDGRVDVYHQPGMAIDPAKYDIAGKGLAHLIPTDFDPAYFEITDPGVQAHYYFRDLHGRVIHFYISEKNRSHRKPFSLLAPMGQAATSPSAMPLIFLFDFYFVRKTHTAFTILVDGNQRTPDALPLPMDGRNMQFTRYSAKPLIATLNPAVSDFIHPVTGPPASISSKGHTLELEHEGTGYGLRSFTRENNINPLRMAFDPPFPNMLSNGQVERQNGQFVLYGHPSAGYISGSYQVRFSERKVQITLHPDGGWYPQPDKWSLRFLYAVGSAFRDWPKAYVWDATLEEKENGRYFMRSGWKKMP